ncbi:winged helix-turn-helix transcriptional regulator [Nitratireductor soli]|uniref:winged helix-turn-helix transcriptional regulator n=1 Tax=Nitratireductor soli TaxID=1670619 RepID=UPI00065E02D4|nr:helix-turn-helix domain-containing protein [Nitratireductor soli]
MDRASPGKRYPVFGCPVEFSLSILGGKWKPVILARLKQQPMRYSDLRRALPRLSDKMLTQRLQDLETDGLVTVEPSEGGTVRFYRLTQRGESLRAVLQALYDWGADQALQMDVRVRSMPPGKEPDD